MAVRTLRFSALTVAALFAAGSSATPAARPLRVPPVPRPSRSQLLTLPSWRDMTMVGDGWPVPWPRIERLFGVNVRLRHRDECIPPG
jgi:hypothetical protein